MITLTDAVLAQFFIPEGTPAGAAASSLLGRRLGDVPLTALIVYADRCAPRPRRGELLATPTAQPLTALPEVEASHGDNNYL